MKITMDLKKGCQFAALLMVGLFVYLTILHKSPLMTAIWLAAGGMYIAVSKTDAAILMIFVFLFPFEMWLPVNFLYLVFFIVAMMRERKIPKALVICAFLFIGLIAPWILTTDGAIIIMIKAQIALIIQLYVILRGYRDVDPIRICRVLRLSGIIFSINILAVAWKFAGSYILEGRLGNGLSRQFPDLPKIPSENMVGFMIALAIISTLVETYYTGKKRYFTLLWFFAVGLLTKSMTFLVLLIIIHVLYYAFVSPKGLVRIKQMVLEGIVMAAGGIAVYSVQPKFFSRFLRRMVSSDISNGRVDIFREYNLSFINGDIWNILFGYGVQGTDVLASGDSLHHQIQAWYIHYGVIGFTCIILVIIYVIWMGYRIRVSKKSHMISMLPLLVFFFEMQTGNPGIAWLLPELLMLRLSKLDRKMLCRV